MRAAVFVALLSALVALPLAAQSNDIGVWAAYTDLRGTNNTDVLGTGVTWDKGVGFGAGWSHWWGSNLTTELAATATRNRTHIDAIGVRVAEAGRLQMVPVTALAQYHLLGRAKVDPYAGAGAAYVLARALSSDDLTALGIGRIDFDNKLAFCINGGVNFNIARSFAVVVDAKYIPVTLNSRASESGVSERLKVNPLIVSGGVRFRF